MKGRHKETEGRREREEDMRQNPKYDARWSSETSVSNHIATRCQNLEELDLQERPGDFCHSIHEFKVRSLKIHSGALSPF